MHKEEHLRNLEEIQRKVINLVAELKVLIYKEIVKGMQLITVEERRERD